jgi:hypothetical protein
MMHKIDASREKLCISYLQGSTHSLVFAFESGSASAWIRDHAVFDLS